jgi:hypothetical protein
MSGNVPDMTLTLREFQRSLGKARRAADAGTEVVITERSGSTYVFKATTTAGKRKTFGEMAGHHFGTVRGGPADLSTNKAHLAGFGRKSMGRG